MTILFAKCLVLVYSIVMCLAVQENTDDFYGINCKIKKSFTNELITPFIEQPSEVTGCYSNSAAITNEEIHVLSLINTGNDVVDTKSGYLPSVTVDVLLRSKKKFFMSSTTIILHSFTPVMWQINLNHIGNSTNFHVIVNKPSYYCSTTIPTIAATISRRKFPSIKRLPLWIKSHYGAVTSYSLIHFANEVILFLGADECSLLPNQVLVPIIELGTQALGVASPALFMNSLPLQFEYNSQPEFLKYNSKVHTIEGTIPQFHKTDIVRHVSLGRNPSLVRQCTRCYSSSMLKAGVRSPATRVWDQRWLRFCPCGGQWRLHVVQK